MAWKERIMKLEQEVQGIVQNILDDYGKNREIDRMKDFFRQPDKEVIVDLSISCCESYFRAFTGINPTKSIMLTITYQL